MIKHTRIFDNKNSQRGDMLIELLMSVALAALVIPFIFRYQQDSIDRAQNVMFARNMESVQNALERYIVENRDTLLQTVGKNITRVAISDLTDYGLNENLVSESGDKYQLRILKSNDNTGQSTLQGVIVMTDTDITPLRTREIVSLGGGNMGFIEGHHAYGTFGAWRADTIDLGVSATDGIVGMTGVNRDNALYLWRVPSDRAADATMMTSLNLGGHDVTNARYFDATDVRFGEVLHIARAAADTAIFQNRTTIDKVFSTENATCAGILSADSRNMNVSNTFSLSDVAKFSNFTTGDLWTSNLTLGGLSISDTSRAATLKVNQSLDMTAGRISAIFATVSFAGSITPRLLVKNRIEDSTNSNFYWDAASRTANLMDVSLAELSRMAPVVANRESGTGTDVGRIFSAVAANKNATAADFMNAISEMQRTVRAKYRLLNLE